VTAVEHLKNSDVVLPTQPARGTFASNAQGRIYGFKTFADYFTPRQLVALTTLSDLVAEAREQVRADAVAAGLPDDGIPLRDGGVGAQAYAEAVSVYLTFGVSRQANRLSTICFWDTQRENVQQVFARQAIPMTWDFVEANPFSNSTGNFIGQLAYPARILDALQVTKPGIASQQDASKLVHQHKLILSTDPPYYDNISYADLSDFFYVWLRQNLKPIYPNIFGTMLVPKEHELIATPYRFNGDAEAANRHFETGLMQAFAAMQQIVQQEYPLTIFYAFK